MTLRQVQAPIKLSGGLERKVDKNTVIPSKLSVADDVEFVDADTVVTREALSLRNVSLTVNPASLAPFNDLLPKRLVSTRVPLLEMELGSFIRAPSATPAYVSQAVANVANAGVGDPDRFPRVGVTTKRLASLQPIRSSLYNPKTHCNVDTATGVSVTGAPNSLIAYEVLEDPAGVGGHASAIAWTLRDATGEAFVSGVANAGGAEIINSMPRVLHVPIFQKYIVLFANFDPALTDFTIWWFSVDATTGAYTSPALLTTIPGLNPVDASAATVPLFDAALNQNSSILAFAARDTAGSLRQGLFSSNSLTPLTPLTTLVPAAPIRSLAAFCQTFAGDTVGYGLFGTGNFVRGSFVRLSTGLVSAEATIRNALRPVGRLDVSDAGSGSLRIVHDGLNLTASPAAGFTEHTGFVTCTAVLVPGLSYNVSTNCFLAGRSFTMGSARYLPLLFRSRQFQGVLLVLNLSDVARRLPFAATATVQPSFCARVDWGECAVLQNGNALDTLAACRLPQASEKLTPYYKYETNTRLAGNTNATPFCLACAEFEPDAQLGDVEFNGLHYLAGALPLSYDGVQLSEAGFHWAPEIVETAGPAFNGLVELTPVATGTGDMTLAPGTYQLAWTEAWEDAQGNWHESGVAFYGRVTTTLGFEDIAPRIIRPPSFKRNRMLLCYRTTEQGATPDPVFYLAFTGEFSASSPVPEIELQSSEPLYTEAALSNTPAPACRQLCAFDERLVSSGCDAGTSLYFTKAKTQGFAAEFVTDNVALKRVTSPEVGAVAASLEMDGRLFVLGEAGLGALAGAGPAGDGTGSNYSPIATIQKDVGADLRFPKSAVLTSDGIWFMSMYGLRLLSRGGAIAVVDGKQLGSEVDDYALGASFIVGAGGGDRQQTRFFTGEHVLVWDSVWRQFSRFTGHPCVDAAECGDTYFTLDNDESLGLKLRFADPTAISDTLNNGDTAPVVGLLETSWLQLGGLQGFQRIYRGLFLGQSPEGTPAGSAQFSLSVGYDYLESLTLETTDEIEAISRRLQVEHQFHRQKCEALKLRIQLGVVDYRIRLTGMTLLVGVKKGPWKEAGII